MSFNVVLRNPGAEFDLALTDAAPTGSGLIKVWSGSAWVGKPVKVWSGGAWVAKPLKRWNGTAWVLVN